MKAVEAAVHPKTYAMEIAHADGRRTRGVFTCIDASRAQPAERQCQLLLDAAGRTFEAFAVDFFAALELVRLELEKQGLRPLVNGANRHCHPSATGRELGAGLSVYRLVIGEKPDLQDLVPTFEASAATDIATVREQQAFHQAWLASFEVKP